MSSVPESTKTTTSADGRHRHIVIVGGGLTGLAAAHRLGELIADRPDVSVTLLEAGARLGGNVGTQHLRGYLIDTGADSFLTNRAGILKLCARLGLTDRLQGTDPRYRGAHVLAEGRALEVPAGFQLMSPQKMWPVLTSPILSPWGKLRLAAEYWVPPRRDAAEESLSSFVTRRLGQETLERLVQPLVGGIYTSDPETLSLSATLPRFVEMEQQHGSLIRAARVSSGGRDAGGPREDHESSGARYGLFAGLKGGMQELVDALSERLPPACNVRKSTAVRSVQLTPADSGPPGYRLVLSDGETLQAETVILTTPAYVTAGIVSDVDPGLSQALSAIDYASSAIVVTGHALARIEHPLNSFGLVIPARERRRILAVSFSSRKFPNRAPAGRVLLRTFVGGAMQPELAQLDDDRMQALVHRELEQILGVRGRPDFALVVRYPRAMPQYTVGHQQRVTRIKELTQAHHGLLLAGNAYFGVGIPDALASGENAAAAAVACLG